MNDAPRLKKILALLDSPHEGEAISALLILRTHLNAQDRRIADFLSDPATELLQENERLQQELELHRTAAAASRHARLREVANSAKWRTLAQKTADQLWDIGRQLQMLDQEPDTDDDLKIARRVTQKS